MKPDYISPWRIRLRAGDSRRSVHRLTLSRVKRAGVTTPIKVTVTDSDNLMVYSGVSDLLAARELKLKRVPFIVVGDRSWRYYESKDKKTN